MGSISYVDRDPSHWRVFDNGDRLRATGEKLLSVCCGVTDDDPGGSVDITLYMRESVFEQLKAGRYRVSMDSSFHGWPIILDQSGAVISPVKDYFCY